MRPQVAWLIGLLTCVAGAVLGQAELIGEPWRHYITIAFVAGTAASGYMLKPPPVPWDGTDRRK